MDLHDLRAWLTNHGQLDDNGIVDIQPAILAGYRLVWNYRSVTRRGGAANAEPAEQCELPGLAMRVSDLVLAGLDDKENHPISYTRTQVNIQLRNRDVVSAWVYLAAPGKTFNGQVPPRREYLDLLIRSAEQHGLPAWHVAALKSTPILD